MSLLIAITGGSGSGKSTLASALRAALPAGTAVLVSEDWYYRDCSSFPEFDAAIFDFDDIEVRDHALLLKHLKALKAGEAVTAPVYDFPTHSRASSRGTPVAPAPVVIVEGSHLLSAPEVAAAFDLTVYVDTPDDVRFIRRLLRDQAERGRSVDSVVAQYLGTVRPAHARFTAPARARADIVVEDRTAAAGLPDPTAVGELLRPVLEHPLVSLLSRSHLGGAVRDAD